MYRVEVEPVLGLPQFTGWSQVVSYSIDHGLANKHLVCAFAVAGEHAGNAGRTLADALRTHQPDEAASFHQALLKWQEQAFELEVNLEFAAGLFSPKKMTLAVAGGSIMLKRKNQLGVVLRSKQEVKLLAGRHHQDDVLILLTHQATDFLNELEQRLSHGFGLESIVSSIVPSLHDRADSSLSSLAFISGGESFESSQRVANVKEQTATPAQSTDKTGQTTFVEIPPALKLRGAGKTRSSLSATKTVSKPVSQITTDRQEADQGEQLAELGRVQKLNKPLMRKSGFQKIGSAIKQSAAGLKDRFSQIDWSQFCSNLRKVVTRLKNGGRSLVTGGVSLWRRLTVQDIYLPSPAKKKRFKAIWLLLLVVVLLLTAVGYWSFRRRQQEILAEAALQPYQEQLTEVERLVETNPVLARREVQTVLANLEELGLSYEDQPRAQELVLIALNRARALAEDISGLEQIDQLKIFFDLRTLDENFVTSQVDATDQRAIFLDEGQQTLVSLNLATQQAQEFALTDSVQFHDLTFADDQLKLLGSGILEIAPITVLDSTQELTLRPESIIAEGDSNREAQLLEAYASYLYVFNADKRDIYRYAQQDTGYSEPIGWVSGAVSFDYQEVSSWAIDGEIWIATREGGLHRLAAGREQEFAVSGLAEPFTSSLKIFTTEDLAELYVLEPDQERLVVLNKEGQFLREIRSASLATTTHLFVSETGQVFAVSGSIIYSLEF